MAITITNSKQTAGVAASSLVFTNNATASNLLVVFLAQTGSTSAPSASDDISGGTGWVVNGTSAIFTASANSLWVAYKTAVGNESTITLTPGSGGTASGLSYYEINGADNTPTLDGSVVHTDNQASGATITSPSVTTTNSGSIILAGVGVSASSGTITAWTGTGPMNNITTTTARCFSGSLIPAATESGVTFTANWTTSRTSAMLVIALKPPGASTLTVSKADTTTTSENVRLQIVSFVNATDTTTTSENVQVEQDYSLPQTGDTTITSENVNVLIPTLYINVSDTTTTSENVAVSELSTLLISVADTTTTSENVQLEELSYISVADTTTTSENVVATELSYVSVADLTTTSENVVVIIPTLLIVVGDSTTASENVVVNVITPSSYTLPPEPLYFEIGGGLSLALSNRESQIAFSNGPPTGTPASYLAVYDYKNDKLYVYNKSSGLWKSTSFS